MWGIIDTPTPLAQTKELQESLRDLLTIREQDDPQVKNAVARVRGYLRARHRMPLAEREKLGFED